MNTPSQTIATIVKIIVLIIVNYFIDFLHISLLLLVVNHTINILGVHYDYVGTFIPEDVNNHSCNTIQQR